MNILKIAGKDIKSIFKHRMVRVSVIAIIIVPLLYSLLYLNAFWDPYSRLSEMPVAVVNLDEGSSLDGERVNYGQDVIENLKGSDELDWNFVTEEDADEGLEGDKYYAKFVIPKDFSSNTLAAKSGVPQVANLKFVCNEKKNFLASQINSKVEGLLKEQIVSTISNQYVTVAFESLYDAKDGLTQAADGSKQLYDGLAQLNDKVPMLEDGTKQLGDGSSQLNDGQKALNKGVTTISEGLGALNGKIPSLSGGVNQLNTGSIDLMNGSNGLYKAFKTIVYPTVQQLQAGANGLSAQMNSEQSKKEITDLAKGAQNAKPGSDKFAADSVARNTEYGNVKTGIDETIAVVNDSSTKIELALNELKNAQNSTNSSEKDANIARALAKLEELKTTNNDASAKIKKLSEDSTNLKRELNIFTIGMQGYTGKVNELADGTTKLIGKVEEVNGGVAKITAGLNGLEAGLNEKTKDTFGEGLANLSAGAGKLNGGISDLKSNIPPLSEGVSALYSGSRDLKDGSNTLVEGQDKLNLGITELSAKVPELKDGVTKLYDGSKELSNKLSDGSKEMSDGLINSPDTMGEYVGAPVNMNLEPINPIKNYGTGFAPYFMALSLWIGAIMMFFVIPSETDDDENTSKFNKVMGKFLSFGFVGVMQAILVSVVVMLLGLNPTNIPLYIGLSIFFSLVFLAIIQCLIFLLGDMGRLLAIVLLILQLTACAGTFPLELVPNVFKVLNPFMPFTYVVEAWREVISATVIDYSVIVKDVSILTVVLVVFLTISVIFKNAGEKFQAMMEDKKEEIAESGQTKTV